MKKNYVVAAWTGRRYVYFCGYLNDKQAVSLFSCCAKRYDRIEDARACADFIDDTGLWEVAQIDQPNVSDC
jgi:hypothetical protein